MSQLAVNSITDANAGNTATINGMTPTADSLQGFRNRILNGGMVIDQRNAGASVAAANQNYTLDRWIVDRLGGAATATVQRSTVAPAGFNNSLLYTIGTGAAPGATDYSNVRQYIEGFNTADLGFGTSAAQTTTLSFWVRSSVTGTYGVCLSNSAYNRNYIASYVVNAANTWEYKTVTIPGDTSGTWVGATNGVGIRVIWDLGVGSTYSGAAGSWTSSVVFGLTGGVKLAATSGATWYITGVQLEVGSVATPFERRPFGTELSLCQRYFYKEPNPAWRLALLDGGSSFPSASAFHPVEMRATPTTVFESLGEFYYNNGSSGVGFTPSGGTTAYIGNTRLGFSRKNSISNGPGASHDQKAGQWIVQLSFSAEL